MREDTGVSVERIAWIFTVIASAAIALLCFLIGYSGYGWTVVAIAVAAAVNLLPEPNPEDPDVASVGSGQPFRQ